MQLQRYMSKGQTQGSQRSRQSISAFSRHAYLFLSILQPAAPVRRKQHHRRTKARRAARNVCVPSEAKLRNRPQFESAEWTKACCGYNARTRINEGYTTICAAGCVRHIAHASSANDRPTLGLFFFALTFDDAAPPTRTRDTKPSSAPSSSSSPRPSPMATAFRLATAALDV